MKPINVITAVTVSVAIGLGVVTCKKFEPVEGAISEQQQEEFRCFMKYHRLHGVAIHDYPENPYYYKRGVKTFLKDERCK